ncbi:hypothetical protein [Calothrix sp. NIES-2100]
MCFRTIMFIERSPLGYQANKAIASSHRKLSNTRAIVLESLRQIQLHG